MPRPGFCGGGVLRCSCGCGCCLTILQGAPQLSCMIRLQACELCLCTALLGCYSFCGCCSCFRELCLLRCFQGRQCSRLLILNTLLLSCSGCPLRSSSLLRCFAQAPQFLSLSTTGRCEGSSGSSGRLFLQRSPASREMRCRFRLESCQLRSMALS